MNVLRNLLSRVLITFIFIFIFTLNAGATQTPEEDHITLTKGLFDACEKTVAAYYTNPDGKTTIQNTYCIGYMKAVSEIIMNIIWGAEREELLLPSIARDICIEHTVDWLETASIFVNYMRDNPQLLSSNPYSNIFTLPTVLTALRDKFRCPSKNKQTLNQIRAECDMDIFPSTRLDARERVGLLNKALEQAEARYPYSNSSSSSFRESLVLCESKRKSIFDDPSGNGGDLTQMKCEAGLLCSRIKVIDSEW